MAHKSESISARADRLFEAAREVLRQDANAILAEHSAKGRLRSGATIIRVTEAFAQRSREALDEVQASAAGRADHRGRKWRSMMALIDEAIDRHMDAAPATVSEFTRVAGANHEALAAPALGNLREELHTRLADFREGWTAPRASNWRERNAVLYALLLLVAGAAISEGVKRIFDTIGPKSEEAGAGITRSPATPRVTSTRQESPGTHK